MLKLPPHLDYVYTVQFLSVSDKNPERMNTKTELIICDGNATFAHICQAERYRIPIRNGVLPQSIPVQWVLLLNYYTSIFLGVVEILFTLACNTIWARLPTDTFTATLIYCFAFMRLCRVSKKCDYQAKLFTILDKAFYGLNVTNSVVNNNTGKPNLNSRLLTPTSRKRNSCNWRSWSCCTYERECWSQSRYSRHVGP